MSDILEKRGRADEPNISAPKAYDFAPSDVRASGQGQTPSNVPPSFRPEMLEAYSPGGYELIPLHSPGDIGTHGQPLAKVPRKGWRTAAGLTAAEAGSCMEVGGNVGVRLRSCDLVIDVDPRNFEFGVDPLARLEEDLRIDLSLYPTVTTGSGGKHIYMLKPDDADLRETLPAYQGLEFKTLGRQVVAAGSVHPCGGTYVWSNDPLSYSLAEGALAPDRLVSLLQRPTRDNEVDAGNRTPEDLEQMLGGLDPLAFKAHDRWLELMMASHHATGGEGREEFINWSVGDPDYADHEGMIGQRWDSLDAERPGKRITEKTLFKALVDAGRCDLLPKGDVAADFEDTLDETGGVGAEWVWVVDAEQFVRRSDCKKWGQMQWKSLYGGEMPDGDIVTAIHRGKFPMRKFEALVYVPGAGEFPDGPTGPRYNIWRASGVEAKAGDVSPFIDHMAYLIPDHVERDHVLDFLALLVQRPAEKLHFALLMRGRQGTGKSWLGQLLVRLIGDRNVVRPSNDEVSSRWTGWMEGHQLGLIEELMTVGRRDVANRLKTVITEPTLRIENKGLKLYTIPNHLNLICFTNHDDALPIEHGDRRWLVISSPAEPLGADYYQRLFEFIEGSGPAAVKHWLMSRQIRLNPKGVAPATSGKEDMRRLSRSEAEEYLLELLEGQEAPFDFDLVRLEDLASAIPDDIRRRCPGAPRNHALNVLREIGAVDHTRYTKANGRKNWQLWSVRRHDHWKDIGAAARMDAFQSHLSGS